MSDRQKRQTNLNYGMAIGASHVVGDGRANGEGPTQQNITSGPNGNFVNAPQGAFTNPTQTSSGAYGVSQGSSGVLYGQTSQVPPQYVVPPTSQPVVLKPQKKGKSKWIAIVLALVCLILAGLLAFNLLGLGETKKSRQGSLGQLEGKTQEEIQAEIDRVVEEGMFNISIASAVQFESGTSEGELRIENVPGNHYLMRVEIMRDDTGEKIYETELIEPNYHIQSDSLDVDLPAGTYPCTAVFYAYDAETEEVQGQAAAKVNISVLS